MNVRGEERAREPVILIVDDEQGLIDVLRAYLQDEGFRVLEASDGRAGVALALESRPDLILLDLNLPLVSGIEAFRTIRAETAIPIIMVTSRVAEVDRIVGLELGADDYVSKPFSPREVVARVKAVLRRTGGAARERRAGDAVRVGPLEIDRAAHEVRRNGEPVPLTPTEFRVLSTLAAHLGKVLSREQLLERVSADGDVYDRTLDRHVANLRQKIEEEPARPKLVLTVIGVGYKLVGPK